MNGFANSKIINSQQSTYCIDGINQSHILKYPNEIFQEIKLNLKKTSLFTDFILSLLYF